MISTISDLLRQLTINLVHLIQSKMATKIKMTAIYQNIMACYCGLLLRVRHLVSVRCGLEKDSSSATKELDYLKSIYVKFVFQNGRQSVLNLAKIIDF